MSPNPDIPLDISATAAEIAHVQHESKQHGHGLYDGPDSSYSLAFMDENFLLRKELRGVRMQLEMMKPEIIMREEGINHTIVVFGSARYLSPEKAQSLLEVASTPAEVKTAQLAIKNSVHYEKAREFGKIVATRNLTLPQEDRLTICNGGGPGVMEAASRGAFEQGDKTIGFNIALPFEQEPNPYITPKLCFMQHYFSTRKFLLASHSVAFCVCPGGFGTFDEAFEILCLIQTKKSKRLPVVFLGKEFWTGMINFRKMADEGVIDEDDLNLFHIVDTPQEAWQIIKDFYSLST